MQVKLNIKIDSSNDAFGPDRNHSIYEVMRILDNIRTKVNNGGDGGSVMDENGNKVGEWSLDIEEDDLIDCQDCEARSNEACDTECVGRD